MIFTLIPTEHVLVVWPTVDEMLEKAAGTTDGRFDKLSILDELIENRIQLWVVYEDSIPVAAVTTRLSQFREFKSLSIDWVGGEKMGEWIDQVLSTIKLFAKDNGCKRLEGRGRTGWKRVLKRYGWRPQYIAYEVELDE